jgi:hypothetical protein
MKEQEQKLLDRVSISLDGAEKAIYFSYKHHSYKVYNQSTSRFRDDQNVKCQQQKMDTK